MNTTKYGKYIVTELKPKVIDSSYEPTYRPGEFLNILNLNDSVIKDAFPVSTNWFFPSEDLTGAERQLKPHTHDFDEVLAMFGSNPEDSYDLGAECEFWLGDEKHVITKSCIIFIPKGLQHGPAGFTRIDRPVFQFSIMKK
ncbi:MAG: hypothetical protein JW882_05880 [Deltaproteobacteria bacterium]|nr:hypothetical protein [Deltaproteobacteria bacterium]